MNEKLGNLDFIEYLSQGVTVFDQNLNLVAWNKKAAELLDFPLELAKIGTPLARFLKMNAERGEYGPGDIDTIVNEGLKLTKQRIPHSFERKRPDGTVLLIEGNFTADHAMVTTYTDITETRLAEKKYQIVNDLLDKQNRQQAGEIEKSRQHLQERNRILEIVTENTKHGISLFDKDLNLLASNARFLELLEFPPEFGQSGTTMLQMFEYNAKRGEYGEGNLEEKIRERIQLALSFNPHKFERVRPDGTVIEIIGTPVKDGFVTTYTDITELRNVQLKLEDATKTLQKTVQQQSIALSQKQFQANQLITAINAMEETIALCDKEGRVVFCNEKLRSLIPELSSYLDPGKPFEGFIRAALEIGFYKLDKYELDAWFKNRMDHYQTASGVFETEIVGGKWFQVQDQRLSDGSIISIGSDITEIKQSQVEKIEAEARFRDFAEIGADWFWEIDQDLRFNYFAGNVKEVTGVAISEFIGKTRQEVQYGNLDFESNSWEKYFQDLENRSDIDNFEYQWLRPDGEIRFISLSGRPHFDESGEFLGYRGVGQDITSRKISEERIRESEERFRTIADNLTEVFWLVNVEENGSYKVLYVNPAFEPLWRHKPEELFEDDSIWYRCVHPDDKDNLKETFQGFIEGRNGYDLEFRLCYPDGSEKIIHSEGQLIKDAAGKIVRVAGVSRDVTGFRRSEQALRRSQKMDAIGQLTGGVAHDFNNILGIIQGNLELLEEMLIGNEAALERIEKGLKGTARGAEITRKLLSFSRESVEEKRLTSVNGFISTMENLIVTSLTASIEVTTELSNDIWPVLIDTGDFEDAILNLSLNARDAMPDGGHLIIETENKVLDKDYLKHDPTGQIGEFVMISVSDTGCGMSKDVREKIFEPFFTTKPIERGTGLGLSMVYGFVKRSGGHMRVYSEPDAGTTFRIYLPRANRKMEIVPRANINQRDLVAGTEKVLVVDDEESLLELTTMALTQLGYDVIAANSGRNALEKLADNEDIDLLFSDVIMPGDLDGYQLAKLAHEASPNLKILLTSGFTKNHEKYVHGTDKFLSELATNLLSKPYSRVDLGKKLRNMLD
ncbi:hypothetical protein A9Q83_00085 [Alphaproteobacteria bacterium 46_93_T64]|nr:hypothetical protein A9Q83_00085 [Alphaproteobacteria bacterium 46_93_T64]